MPDTDGAASAACGRCETEVDLQTSEARLILRTGPKPVPLCNECALKFWRELSENHQEFVERQAKRRAPNVESIRDVAQTVHLVSRKLILTGRWTLRETDPEKPFKRFKPKLRRVFENLRMKEFRDIQKRQVSMSMRKWTKPLVTVESVVNDGAVSIQQVPSSHDAPEEQLVNEESDGRVKAIIEQELSDFPETHQEAFRLRLQGMKKADVASLMGVTDRTIYDWLRPNLNRKAGVTRRVEALYAAFRGKNKMQSCCHEYYTLG